MVALRSNVFFTAFTFRHDISNFFAFSRGEQYCKTAMPQKLHLYTNAGSKKLSLNVFTKLQFVNIAGGISKLRSYFCYR